MSLKHDWKCVDDDLNIWQATYLVPNFISNTYLVPLNNDHWLCFSPGCTTSDIIPDEILKNGKITYLVAPNAFHFLGIKEWKEKFPNAQIVASRGSMRRLKKKMKVEIHSLDIINLPEHIQTMEPQSMRWGETWIQIKKQNKVSWIIGDTFFNFDKMSKNDLMRYYQIIMKAAPGLKMSSLVKWFMIKNRKKFKKWFINQVSKSHPKQIFPLHGKVLNDDNLSEQILDFVETRL